MYSSAMLRPGVALGGYPQREDARDSLLDRMVAEAESLGADVVLDVRFGTSYVMASAAEILVYGNAVKLEKV